VPEALFNRISARYVTCFKEAWHREFNLEERPMETSGLTEASPPTESEKEQEDKFEKESTNPDKPSPFHLNVYSRTFLGGLLLFAMVLFYVTHI